MNIKWENIAWKGIDLFIYDLQYKIFSHAKTNNISLVRYYQRKLVKSKEGKLLAIRFVTQDNRGKATAGVDGIAKLNNVERIDLSRKLVFDSKASKIIRVFIPKANGKRRSLGIPTIEDRCKQMLMKMALEPEWEARFEVNSYGFRPGYSAADAKWCIARQLQGGPKYFLDADIEGCFDNIDHTYLINKLDTISMFKNQIWSWLKAGIMHASEKESSDVNEAGTPQGGVLSPLLMNIALHGMETHVMKPFGRNEIKVVRYADDFVIFSKTLENIQSAEKLVVEFLKPVGLRLSKDKTRIGHSMSKLPGTSDPVGLDFLSFNFKNIPCSIHRGVKSTQGVKQTFRLVTRPSKEAVIKHKMALSRILVDYKSAPMGRIMERLSSRIRGWTWYHSVTQSTKTFSKLDEWLWKKLWKWAKRRHRGAEKAKLKCFSVQGWNFGYITNEGSSLILDRHDKTKVRKFIKIKSGYSIYNGDLVYFAKRLSLSNPRIKNLNNLFRKQKFSCPVCSLPLLPNQVVELHHHLDENGKRTDKINFVHGHCHDKIHSTYNIPE